MLMTDAAIGRRLVLLGITTTIATAPVAHYAEVQAQTAGALSSWNDGLAKQAILDFVRTTTDRSSSNFVAPEVRIATFDQHGTLWVEHPLYTHAAFALDRVHDLAPRHPEWQNQEPFKSVRDNDWAAMGRLRSAHGGGSR